MRTTFSCSACGATIAADIPVGGRVRCPLCHAIVTVPEPPYVLSGTQTPPTNPNSSIAVTPQIGSSAAARPAPPAQGSAIGALVCGIIGMIGCAFPVGLIGLILGIVGTLRASRDPQTCGGKNMAISGIVLGGLSLVVWPILWVVMVNVWYEPFTRSVCEGNLTAIHEAMFVYALESDGEFPEQEQGWQNRLVATGYVMPEQFDCWADDVTYRSSYFYVPGYNLNADPDQVIVYEHPKIHEGGGHILRIDGTVEFVESVELMDLLSDLALPDGTHWAPHERP